MLDREQVLEIAASVGAVLVMLAAMAVVGSTYGTGSKLTPEGGWILVWVIVGFIILLTVIGIGLAYALNEPEDGFETNGGSNAGGTF
ncbi:hypothetical protein HYG82_14140 [Natrinema halophilum]|uniref:Uncharacterized protein n=2 Tax=Natrinema halophilum TaxID=1699371 RepID=A0A7D5GNW5_9EURY|nr:hypothetical protein [Natrinema halophilum]QLG51232.1 hypothetical protein HYG82_14140 [Natrinema halophilum]